MKKVLGLLCGMTLLCVPLFAVAQEDGGVEDATAATDAYVPTDAATGTDSATGTDAGATGCGTVTYFGECTATGVAWCDDGDLVEYDCPADRPCGMLDCDDGIECLDITDQTTCEGNTNCFWSTTYSLCAPSCYGYECLSAAGGDCNVFFEVDLDGDGYADFWPCQNSAGYGCLDGTCAMSTTCADDDPPQCSGNMIEYCYRGTFNGFDCSFGGAQPYECGNDSTGEATCLGQEGAQCSVSEGLECVTGLTCTGGICTGGTTQTDAGTTPRDSGSSGGTDSGSSGGDDDDADTACLCTAGQASSGAALLVAMMLGMALLRRRR